MDAAHALEFDSIFQKVERRRFGYNFAKIW